MKSAFSISLLTACLVSACVTDQHKHTYRPEMGSNTYARPQRGRAISLRNLQRAIQGCLSSACPDRLKHLGGITLLQGYAIDICRGDIVLFGIADQQLPYLHLEDLIVAMRNAWFKFSVRKGNTVSYSAPGCSIDPDPIVAQELSRVTTDRWDQVCQKPQQVRVLGIPTDLHFAQVMVQADYDMKRIVNGMDSIPEIESLTDIHIKRMKDRVDSGKIGAAPPALSRFWFSPGENVILVNSEGAILEKSEIRLLTEAEHLSPGKMVGTGRADPLSKIFAQEFTRKFDEISSQRPVYKELENLFRFVSIAKVLKSRNAAEIAGLDLSVLLDRYILTPTHVSRTLPGVPCRNELKYNGYEMRLRSCGGVSMEFAAEKMTFRSLNIGLLSKVVSNKTESQDEVFWGFPN